MASEIEKPLRWNDGSWDCLKLGDFTLPGIWDVSGSVERKIDHKTTKGKDGASVKDLGYQPGKFTFRGQFHDMGDWETMKVAFKIIHPSGKNVARVPLTITHPGINAIGIDTIYISGIDVPKLSKQILTVEIKAIEWRPAPVKIKPKAGYGDVDAKPSLTASWYGQSSPTTIDALSTTEPTIVPFWEGYLIDRQTMSLGGARDTTSAAAVPVPPRPRQNNIENIPRVPASIMLGAW